MQAQEAKIQTIIEGTRQYLVPLFQRQYSWQQKQWKTLLEDLVFLYNDTSSRVHFFGSIVIMPESSTLIGVNKYILIDGQQRLTTLIIILAILRDIALESGDDQFAEETNDTFIVNRYKQGLEYYKLLPTQADREELKAIIDRKHSADESLIRKCYIYFYEKITKYGFDFQKFRDVISNRLSMVGITLDTSDNPYKVFESLNAKGMELSHADLIRNYFFMKIPIENQKSYFDDYWLPMQNRLGAKLTEFIRHYLMMSGNFIRQSDVYNELRDKVSIENAKEYLIELAKTSFYYEMLLNPEKESDARISRQLQRLNIIEVTTAYPLLLSYYIAYKKEEVNLDDFYKSLNILESFLIRRFVCGFATNQLNKILTPLTNTLRTNYYKNYLQGISELLAGKQFPSDYIFRKAIVDNKLYGAGNKQQKTKLILESIEESLGHKEKLIFSNISIEHIMPQTLNDKWKKELGDDWAVTHDNYLHTLGNLTLTAYNSELGNLTFKEKSATYKNSHLELNAYFVDKQFWDKNEIIKRGNHLADKMISIWPSNSKSNNNGQLNSEFRSRKPISLKLLDKEFPLQSWKNALIVTSNELIKLNPLQFPELAKSYSTLFNQRREVFRRPILLDNGWYIESNFSADSIVKICRNLLNFYGLSEDVWKVTIKD